MSGSRKIQFTYRGITVVELVDQEHSPRWVAEIPEGCVWAIEPFVVDSPTRYPVFPGRSFRFTRFSVALSTATLQHLASGMPAAKGGPDAIANYRSADSYCEERTRPRPSRPADGGTASQP
jgi:hypothetical protein